MSTQCAVQQAFSFRRGKEVAMGSDDGRITSDAGLVALRQFDHRIGFTEQIVACPHDERNPMRVIHTVMVLAIQRLYALFSSLQARLTSTTRRPLNRHSAASRRMPFGWC